MSELKVAEDVAESLRQEPYHLFRNDCLTKSLCFRSECRKRRINAHVVWCALGLTKAKLPLLGEVSIPYSTHLWARLKARDLKPHAPSVVRADLVSCLQKLNQ